LNTLALSARNFVWSGSSERTIPRRFESGLVQGHGE
jgi:hypothetical protein